MKLISGLILFAAGVYLLASAPQGSMFFWFGFAATACGLLLVSGTRRKRTAREGAARRPNPAQPRRGRRAGGGSGGNGHGEAHGEADGDGGDGAGGGGGGGDGGGAGD